MRTKGATSCVFVPLDELNKLLRPDVKVPVNRQFAELLGFNVKHPMPRTKARKHIKA